MRSMLAGTIAGSCVYAYDAAGALARIQMGAQTRQRFWSGESVVNELRTAAGRGSEEVTWLRTNDAPFAEIVHGAQARTTLLGAALAGSVLVEADTALREVAYAPHGHRPDAGASGAPLAEPAYNGEMLDAGSGCYLLGVAHHRPYSPTLGIFLAPDSESPFARGGLNALSYCQADPINHTDPTGHFLGEIFAVIGVVVGVAVAALSFGTAIPAIVAAGGLAAAKASSVATLIGGVSAATGVAVDVGAMAATAAGNETASLVLGAVGLGLGIAGAAPLLAKAAIKGARAISKFSQMRRFGGIVRAARRADAARGGPWINSPVGRYGPAEAPTGLTSAATASDDVQDGVRVSTLQNAPEPEPRLLPSEKPVPWTMAEELRRVREFRSYGEQLDVDVDGHLEVAARGHREFGNTRLAALVPPPRYRAPPSYQQAMRSNIRDQFELRNKAGWRGDGLLFLR